MLFQAFYNANGTNENYFLLETLRMLTFFSFVCLAFVLGVVATTTEKMVRARFEWQDEALGKYLLHATKFFLCEACVGAGKTIFGCKCMKKEKARKDKIFFFLVGPTVPVCKSWRKKAHKNGLDLARSWNEKGKGKEKRSLGSMLQWPKNKLFEYDGIVLTYAAMALYKNEIEAICKNYTVMVILDEIHHLSDDNSWGRAAEQAFGSAYRILGLTGTCFRPSGGTIPWVLFGKDGMSIGDFTYRYNNGISDGINRVVTFYHENGDKIKWEYGDEDCEHSFDETLSKKKSSQRLYTALWTEGVLGGLLRTGIHHLNAIRKIHKDAGMIVFAMNIKHAEKIVEMLQAMGETPVLVHSEDEDGDGHQKLEDFEHSNDRILVSVAMVSEGVDIPRLRVGVYATNVVDSLLYWWQCLGRIVRRMDESLLGFSNRDAAWVQPQDPILVNYARNVLKLQKIALVESDPDPIPGVDGGDPPDNKNKINPLSSEGFTGTTVHPKDEHTNIESSGEKTEVLRRIQGSLNCYADWEVLTELDSRGLLNLNAVSEAKEMPNEEIDGDGQDGILKKLKDEAKHWANQGTKQKYLKNPLAFIEGDYKGKWLEPFETWIKEGNPPLDKCDTNQLNDMIVRFKKRYKMYREQNKVKK